MNDVACFMLERTDLARRELRRYSNGGACPLMADVTHLQYHNASVVIVDAEPYEGGLEGETQLHDRDDPRWPKACGCGRPFLDEDNWQVNVTRLYQDPRTGARMLLGEAPAGAMWYADWYARAGWVGADGRSLVVMLPDRTPWLIDGPAQNAPGKIPGWTREGVPPNVTARPSIQTPMYHGFLTAGHLIRC